MALNNNQEKNCCPHCQVFVVYDEIQTHQKLIIGQSKVKVLVYRCPECKKIARPIIHLD